MAKLDNIIPVAKPSLGKKELEYVTDAVKTGWISAQGGYIEKFEEAWAKYNKMKYGVAVNNGTSALTVALRAAGIQFGDEVIVPEFTMVSTAWAVSYVGAKAVFLDCDDTLNMDVTKIEQMITPRTKAILVVHVYGRQANMKELKRICYEHGLLLIEDSAEAHGIKPEGDIACYSLMANKIITAGEGGIVLTNDARIAEQMKYLRSLCFNENHTFLHKKMGYNFKMTNMQAAVALAQVERIDEILKKRKQIEKWYDAVVPEQAKRPNRDVLWMYDIVAPPGRQQELIDYLKSFNIESRMFFKPMSQQPMYFNPFFVHLRASFWANRGIYLPTFTDLTKEEIDYIGAKLVDFYAS